MSTTTETAQPEQRTKPAGKVRKRAAKACLSCRARKVRCDVSQRGRPCMNCYLDSETCVVTGRASRLQCSSVVPTLRNRSEQQRKDSRRYNVTSFLASEAPLWVGDQRIHVNADITYSYYPFLSMNNLPNIMPQDVNYLESQGCFRVPTREILDEFVQQYFLHVHPVLPMLNEGDFWDMYGDSGHGGSGERMSLLVLQTMLFSSCNFVSKTSIKSLGYPSIRAARATLYRRCKLLYDFDSETSMVYRAQSALLLSHWSPNFTHAFKKANSTWLGIAIQDAKSAEAHHYSAMPTYSATANPAQRKKQNVLKRLWWCCILRDRILPLGLRRSLKITRAHFDFDAQPGLGYLDLADEIDRSKVYNSGTKRCLIEIFVQLVELGTVLTDLIMLVFPLDDSPGWGKQGGPEDANKARECRHALRRWYKGATLRFPPFGGDAVARMAVPGIEDSEHDSVILYTNLMYMYYHSARVVLSHHEVLHTAVAAVSPNLTTNMQEFSNIYENRHELQDAASGVTECLKELIQMRLARWLPIPAVACTALPLVLHIIDVKLSTYNKSTSSAITTPQQAVKQHRLNILIEAMKTYQPQYDGVDYVSETIRHIVTLAQLDTPAPPSVTNPINDWQDILASQPGCYLRLAMTMDLSLSKGRLPEEADFPASLRGLFTAGYSSVKALMEAGKTTLSPLPRQGAYVNPADQLFFSMNMPVAPGTVQSLPSDAGTDSPSSSDDRAAFEDNSLPQHNYGEDLRMVDHGFVDAAIEMEGLAGGVLAAYTLQQDSPQSSSSYSDENGTVFDGETTMTDWIDNAWGSDVHPDAANRGDQETAQALLDAIANGEGVGIECSA
ncbi:hypothetical protein BKA67DRAFT_679981 [Truncatella angustata]|uniref:Zn(2)-C6 fungal-type domain-containing protein n=1 Tax=Truncatella angustata TaxID=152316 RepID=A0A9P8ZV46_9PEZI|nr:uncharacterized protein BKA67DRAFT_679981 [Truncatella angustata]KAH6651705.1 hypothetical protein BKA67DRAFT_679981 [Truncatella angustata]